MSLTMDRVVLIVVLTVYVFCEITASAVLGKNATSVPVVTSTEGNPTSSVLIDNKVQNVSVEYTHDHSRPLNTSQITESYSLVKQSTEKPLTISTTKAMKLTQTTTPKSKTSTNTSLISKSNTNIKPHPNLLSKIRNIDLKIDASSQHSVSTTIHPPKSTNKVKNTSSQSDHFNILNKSFKSITTSPSDINIEKMEVKEMRYIDDPKDNKKFRFYMVSDGNASDTKPKTSKSSQMIHINYSNKTRDEKHSVATELKPPASGNSDYSVPYNNFQNKNPHYSSVTTEPPYYKSKHHLTYRPQVYTVRPNRQTSSISITTPRPYHKKFNSTAHLAVTKKPNIHGSTRDFSCLRCVGNKDPKPYKYPSYPTKKDPHSVDGNRAVKLQGPDNDSILGSSKQHYMVVRPELPKTGPKRGHKSVMKDYLVNQKDARKPFISTGSLGSYASKPAPDFPIKKPDANNPTINNHNLNHKIPIKNAGSSDLYNLDELQPSGSSNNHVKYETKEIHIPYPVKIEKKVSFPIHITVERPVPVHIDKPYPVHVEKKVPVPVKVHVPHPYPVEKEVPYPVKVPVEVPRAVQVPKPVPYVVENPVPVQIVKHVRVPVKIPVDVPVPYKVQVPVEKRVPYLVEKKVPFEVPVPVEKPHFIEVKKPFDVIVEKPYPVTVERKVPVPVQIVEFIEVPIPVKVPHDQYKSIQHRSGGVEQYETEADKYMKHMFMSENVHHKEAMPPNLPRMISVEFPPSGVGHTATTTAERGQYDESTILEQVSS